MDTRRTREPVVWFRYENLEDVRSEMETYVKSVCVSEPEPFKVEHFDYRRNKSCSLWYFDGFGIPVCICVPDQYCRIAFSSEGHFLGLFIEKDLESLMDKEKEENWFRMKDCFVYYGTSEYGTMEERIHSVIDWLQDEDYDRYRYPWYLTYNRIQNTGGESIKFPMDQDIVLMKMNGLAGHVRIYPKQTFDHLFEVYSHDYQITE